MIHTHEHQRGTWHLAMLLVGGENKDTPITMEKESYGERELVCGCGKAFIAKHNSAKYCPSCTAERYMKRQNEYIARRAIQRRLEREEKKAKSCG